MDTQRLSRRDLLRQGSTALAGLALLHAPPAVPGLPEPAGRGGHSLGGSSPTAPETACGLESAARVDVQINGGSWVTAHIDRSEEAEFAWKLWHLEWAPPFSGEYRITSHAVDAQGNAQPAPDDPRIAKKYTYWESNGQVTRRIRIT